MILILRLPIYKMSEGKFKDSDAGNKFYIIKLSRRSPCMSAMNCEKKDTYDFQANKLFTPAAKCVMNKQLEITNSGPFFGHYIELENGVNSRERFEEFKSLHGELKPQTKRYK